MLFLDRLCEVAIIEKHAVCSLIVHFTRSYLDRMYRVLSGCVGMLRSYWSVPTPLYDELLQCRVNVILTQAKQLSENKCFLQGTKEFGLAFAALESLG